MDNNGKWKDEIPKGYQGYADAAEKGPVTLFLKVFALLVLVSIIIGTTGWVLGWFGSAGQVVKEEFGPRPALDKYEWFINQANAIKKMDQDIAIFKKRETGVKDQYKGYGEDMAKWPPHIQAQYNKDVGQARDDRAAIISQRNNLVREYNAASAKFNWRPFETNANKPDQTFKELTD